MCQFISTQTILPECTPSPLPLPTHTHAQTNTCAPTQPLLKQNMNSNATPVQCNKRYVWFPLARVNAYCDKLHFLASVFHLCRRHDSVHHKPSRLGYASYLYWTGARFKRQHAAWVSSFLSHTRSWLVHEYMNCIRKALMITSFCLQQDFQVKPSLFFISFSWFLFSK